MHTHAYSPKAHSLVPHVGARLLYNMLLDLNQTLLHPRGGPLSLKHTARGKASVKPFPVDCLKDAVHIVISDSICVAILEHVAELTSDRGPLPANH